MNNKKYEYIQIGIASAEEIISWANPVLREEVKNGNVLKYNPLRKDKMAVYDKDGNFLKDYDLKGEVKKHETINYRTQNQKKMVYSVKLFLDQQKTINVLVVNHVRV